MAHFIGIIKGDKQAVSRCGTKNSGIKASINGWYSGCAISVVNTTRGDYFTVTRTGGSNGALSDEKVIAQWYEEKY